MARLAPLVMLLALTAAGYIDLDMRFKQHDQWACELEILINADSLPATAGRKGGFACFFESTPGEMTDGDPGFLFVGTISDQTAHGDWALQDGGFEPVSGLDGSSNDIWFERVPFNAESGEEFAFDDSSTSALFDYRTDSHDFTVNVERYNIPNIMLNLGQTTQNPSLQCYYRRFSSPGRASLFRETDLAYWFKVEKDDTTFDSSECVNRVVNLPRFVTPSQTRYPGMRRRSVEEICPYAESNAFGLAVAGVCALSAFA